MKPLLVPLAALALASCALEPPVSARVMALNVAFNFADATCAVCSPKLSIAGEPEGTTQFTVLFEDLTAPRPPRVIGTVARSAAVREIPAGALQGYVAPPMGPPHCYRFTVRALDAAGGVLAEGQAVAPYPRPPA